MEQLLRAAERSIALLLRCQPKNAQAEQARLTALVEAARFERPKFVYADSPDLAGLRAELQRAAQVLGKRGPLERLYAERANELTLEAELAESIGRPEFRALAAQRFAPLDATSADGAHADARRYVELAQEEPSAPLLRSDDARHPHSLWNRMQRRIGECRLPFRTEVRAMAAAAATGDRVVYVAEGRWLSATDTDRIVEHEVMGHAFPRERAAREPLGLFAVGSARGSDEQEGYALLREVKGGFFDARRKRELGLRHLAALSVQAGADWTDTVRLLRDCSMDARGAVAVASRVHRGGGLAREVSYLPALHRVSAAVDADPRTLDWLGRGRLSLEAIATLRLSAALPQRTRSELVSVG
jgi:hypothetical protein